MELRYRGSQGSSIIGIFLLFVLLSNVNFHIQPITKLWKFQIRDDEPPEIKEDDGTTRNTELEKVW